MLFFEENVWLCLCVKLTRNRRNRYTRNIHKRSVNLSDFIYKNSAWFINLLHFNHVISRLDVVSSLSKYRLSFYFASESVFHR